ncbi:MAG TPA: hypothetical protein VGL42_12610 [Opitutaceae bacterium]
MNPHAPQSYGPPVSGREIRSGKVMQDQIWGRPVFRPPTLGNPPISFDSNPFRLHSFVQPRPSAGR